MSLIADASIVHTYVRMWSNQLLPRNDYMMVTTNVNHACTIRFCLIIVTFFIRKFPWNWNTVPEVNIFGIVCIYIQCMILHMCRFKVHSTQIHINQLFQVKTTYIYKLWHQWYIVVTSLICSYLVSINVQHYTFFYEFLMIKKLN